MDESTQSSALPPQPSRWRWLLWAINLAATVVAGLGVGQRLAWTQTVASTTGGFVQPLIEPVIQAVVPTQVSGFVAPRLPFVEPLAKPGGRILFARDGAIWVWVDGEVRALTPSGGNEQPRWSPDGTGIAYVHRGRNFSDIWIMDASGHEARQITRNGSPARSQSVWAFAPQWSPDGRFILYLSDARTYDLALWEMEANGSGTRRLSFLADFTGGVQGPSWSANGERIAAAAFFPDQKEQVYLFDRASSRWTAVTGVADGAYDASLSPDGRQLAYVARDQGKHDVWVMDLQTHARFQATFDGMSRAPCWSPSGDQLLFLSGKDLTWDIWLVDITAGDTGLSGVGRPREVTRGLNADPASGLSWWK